MRRTATVWGGPQPAPPARTAPAAGGHGPQQAPPQPLSPPVGLALWLLAALWIFVLFEFQWLVEWRFRTRALLRAPLALYIAVAVVLALGTPLITAWRRRFTLYLPLLAFIGICLIAWPFAPNRGRAMEGIQMLGLMWTLVVATVTLVNTVRRAELLLLVYAFQFLWFGLWGARSGLVPYNTGLSNYDGYGAFMVIGGGLCTFLIFATDNKWLKRAMILTVGLCAIGVVASFARGALLAGGVVAFVVWARSPRKGMTLALGVLCGLLVMVAAAALFGDTYWEEMSTIFEGTEEATGEDRWELWKAAWQVFLQRPFFGVGINNFGVFAASYFRPGEVGGNYYLNPTMLYDRELHSSYFEILSEQGIAGVFVFAWILRDFWRRNFELRTPAAEQRWKALGGRLRLRPVALGVEVAFIGWMTQAALYSQGGLHWLYTLLGLNLLLHSMVVSGRPDQSAAGGRRARGRLGGHRAAPAP